jgi:hypothetical protein
MAIDTTQLTDYSWSDIAKAAKGAMMSAAVGGGELRMPDGRTIKRITIEEAKKLYDLATANANTEANTETGGGIVLAQFGDAQ